MLRTASRSFIFGLSIVLSNAMWPTTAIATDAAMQHKDFMRCRMMTAMTEVKLGQIAETKSSNPQVLNLAAAMILEHTKAIAALKHLADEKSMALPAELDARHQAVVDRLSQLTSAKFDRGYIDRTVQDHTVVVASLEAERKISDGALKSWCDSTLPIARDHLKIAQNWNNQTQ